MDFDEIFLSQSNEKGLFSFLDSKEILSLSKGFDRAKVQRGDLFRLQSLSRHLANFIIDDDGDLFLDKVDFCIEKGADSRAFLLEDNFDDAFFVERMIQALIFISSDKTFIKKLKKLSLPVANKRTEGLIRQTLLIGHEEKITNAHVRKAIICALLTPLRQTVGSCFATALGILVQKQDLMQLFLDLEELIKTGTLKRVIHGKVYYVPQNPSMGMGELRRAFSLEQFMLLPHCPSLQFAFDRVDHFLLQNAFSSFFSLNAGPQEKKETIQTLILDFLEEQKANNLYELLEGILKKHFSLKEEDFLAKKRLEKTEFFIASQMHAQGLNSSKKKEKIDQYFIAKEILFSTFQSFVDSPLLKSWEYTLASFCDVKREFTLWNLFSSLGLSHEDKEGVGGFLYKEIEKKLQEVHQEIIAMHQEATLLEGKIRGSEAILHRIDIPTEEVRLRSEIAAGMQSIQMLLNRKEEKEKVAEGLSELYSYMIKTYMELFEDYFQEVYDPEMVDYPSFDYNDSPAGFRLLYTHGRKDTSTWSPITDAEEFIRELRDFFMVTENRVIAASHYDLREEISLLTTELIQYIQSPVFIESALKRVQVTHQSVLGEMEKQVKELIVQKPWGYISGGTLDTLVQTYFKKDGLEKEEKLIETPSDLFSWLTSILKKQEHVAKTLLAFNGGHAFLLCPYFSSFQSLWQKEAAAESLLQTFYEMPSRAFITGLHLTKAMQVDLISEYMKNSEKLEEILASFIFREEVSVSEFTGNFLSTVNINPNSFIAFLYKALLIPQSPAMILDIFDQLPFDSLARREKAKNLFDKRPLNALSLQREVKKCLIQTYESVSLPYDYHKEILNVLNDQKKIFPRPILFADTNWPCYLFGFVYHPLTLELDLWRFDTIGFEGYPLSEQTPHFNSNWGVIFEKLFYENLD